MKLEELKVGQKVRIRQWDDMAKEFGVDDEVEDILISWDVGFPCEMRPLCGEIYTINNISRDGRLSLSGKQSDKWCFLPEMLEPVNPYFMVFIEDCYIRDAQAFTAGKIRDEDDENECEDEDRDAGWQDISGSVLVYQGFAMNKETVLEKLRTIYPDADKGIFDIYQMTERPKLV